MISFNEAYIVLSKCRQILPRSSTEEALKRVETYLPDKSKVKSFDNLASDLLGICYWRISYERHRRP